MNNWLVLGLLVLLAAAVLGGFLVWLRARLDAQRHEMESLVSTHAQAIAGQLVQLTQGLTQQVGQLNQSLQQGVSQSGQLASQAQQAVASQLQASTETLQRLGQQLGEVQSAGRDLSQTAQRLEMVLGAAQTRGRLGEIALERLLEDALPRASYEWQYRFASNEVVDAVVRLGEKLLSIDSKFPLDDYRRLVETGEEARKGFAQAVRSHADAIAKKYILPSEGTLDIALMFVPSESVYYEILMTEDARSGRLDEYCRSKRVIPVSPNSLYAYLSVILMGLRGMQIEENARLLLGQLGGLQRQLDGFTEVYDRLGTHLRNAQKSFEEAGSKLEKTRTTLAQMAEGQSAETSVRILASTDPE